MFIVRQWVLDVFRQVSTDSREITLTVMNSLNDILKRSHMRIMASWTCKLRDDSKHLQGSISLISVMTQGLRWPDV